MCVPGGPVGCFVFPPLNVWLVEQYGWRHALGVDGTALLIVLIVAAVVLHFAPVYPHSYTTVMILFFMSPLPPRRVTLISSHFISR
jgi:MFS family permease